MYSMNAISMQNSYTQNISAQGDGSAAAMQLFKAMMSKGRLGRLWSKLTGRKNGLKDLHAETRALQVTGRHHAGVQAVPVSRIRGSEGRRDDFDAHFNPLSSATRDRWISIARARLAGVSMPAVELIRLRDEYYVRDGHHRISVARAFGEQAIDAQVTVWETLEEPSPAQDDFARPSLAEAEHRLSSFSLRSKLLD
jgi:hypothetical protein